MGYKLNYELRIENYDKNISVFFYINIRIREMGNAEILKNVLDELAKCVPDAKYSAYEVIAIVNRAIEKLPTAELRAKITGSDLFLRMGKQVTERVRTENKEEKPEVEEYTLQEVTDKISGYIETRNSNACVELGDAIIIKHNIRAVKKIELLNGNTARAIVELNDGSGIFATINLHYLMGLKF